MPFVFVAVPSAVIDFHCPDQDAPWQVIASDIFDPILLHIFGIFFFREPAQAGINLNPSTDVSLNRAVLDLLDSPHDRFGVRLTNAEGSQVLDRLVIFW